MKILKLLTVMLLIGALLPVNAFASQPVSDSTIYHEDGSYTVITVRPAKTRSAATLVGYKDYTHYTAAGETQWIATLTGYFTYDGTTSTCTYSSLNVEIVNTNWYIVSGLSQESDSSATAELIMGYKALGITVTKKTVHMSISCDPNGNLS